MHDQTHESQVIDKRPKPLGVIPRHAQTWLMVGLTVVILAIIVFTGTPEPQPSIPYTPPSTASLVPSPERVRDFGQRLANVDRNVIPPVIPPVPDVPRSFDDPPIQAQSSAPVSDPIAEDRKRREYESLFSSNVVLSRRPEGKQLQGGDIQKPVYRPTINEDESAPSMPTLDEVAQAVAKATGTPTQQTVAQNQQKVELPQQSIPPSPPNPAPAGRHRVFEGTIIDGVLTNRLEGSMAGPVNCLVTNAVYAHDDTLVIPAGARILGSAKPVQAFGESRLAVGFHRVVLPNGRDFPLQQFPGANQLGDVGLKDRVNNHYWSTFGAAGAVGFLSGLAQFSAGFGSDSTTVVLGGTVGDSASQAMSQTLGRFLNRLPTITIREGHRVKVYLTGDLDLPEYR